MSRMLTVAIDAMSGDGGTAVIVDAVRTVLAQRDDAHLVLVGDPDHIKRAIGLDPLPEGRYSIVAAEEVVTMDDSAAIALRSKKKSSMRIAINLVKDGSADACVSAGNTGALMAISRFVLKTVPGIDRPAISAIIPAVGGHTHMLDLGANVDSSADHLYQFAMMGSILAQAIDGVERPRVGLLNIGSEDIKGNEQVKLAAPLLSGSPLNYIGYVEGNDIYTDRVDVVVCDGFVGNVSLKTSEGVAKMVSHYIKEEFKRSLWNKLVGLLAKPILQAFGNRIDPRRYNGASLLGLQGVVVKSHGGADALAFANAINIALLEIGHNVPSMIAKRVEETLSAA
ncbi:phosphate acyltransferase PlsX [Granulosicoccus sp.]|nr:phosphate acyltransferase PlsX [Granulosicoccus sp.]MDB4223734.1 phosphate acyltransferase PlsX [Granulosicoccus sp.]